MIFLSDHQRLAIDSIPVDGSFYFCGPAIDDRGRGLRNKIEEGNNASVIEIFLILKITLFQLMVISHQLEIQISFFQRCWEMSFDVIFLSI